MNIRTIATLAIAILLGVMAVLLVRNYLNSDRTQVAQGSVAGTTPVVVATQAIARGKPIEAAQIRVVRYPSDAVPVGAFQNVADISGVAADRRMALRSIAPNEPVLASRLSGPGSRPTLSGGLTVGMRAVSLRSNDVSGVGGFVLPGDRVDILLTRAVGTGDHTSSVTQVLAENVRVLGVDQMDDEETDKPVVAKAVTVEVTSDQAQAISLAQSVGAVSLALRHASDEAVLRKRVTTVADLGGFGVRQATPAVFRRAVVRPAGTEIRVTRGIETAGYRIP